MENTNTNELEFFNEKPSDLIKEHRQVYLLINAIAKRVRQLQLGDRALALPANGNREALYISQEEFLQDKLKITERVAAPIYDEFGQEANPGDMDALLGLDDDDDVSLDASDGDE